jgi:hypothetical protein
MTQLDIVERKNRDGRGRPGPRLLAPLALLLLLDAAPAWAAPLLLKADLQYAGAFRVPADQSAQQSFGYGAMGMAYNPSRNSLYMVGHLWYQQTAEVSIPEIRQGATPSSLARSTVLQWGDATDGNLAGSKIYGQLVHNGKLYGIGYNAQRSTSHFVSGLDLSAGGDFQGFYQVGTLSTRFVAGYMAEIAPEWRTALGGTFITGGCCNPGDNGATSLGPAAFVFNPADIGVTNPVSATPLVYYSAAHPTLGAWNNTTTVNLLYNLMTEVVGAVFVPGTQTALFFGRTGLGVPCFGNGTNDPALDRQPWSGGGVYCYDPNEVDGGLGPHAYPYAYHVWAYDVQDFVAAKNGQKSPWDVRPYANWTFDLPYQDSHRHIQGVAFDPASSRIFLSQSGGEPDGIPVIHVFTVSSAQIRPAAPTNLRLIP